MQRVNSITRDATLASLSGVALLALLAVMDALHALARPGHAALGLLGALALEWLFVAETPAVDLWNRRPVRVGSVVGLLLSCGLVAVTAGPWLVAAACWGIVTYFLLLGLLSTGLWTPAVGGGDDEDADRTENSD